MSRRGHAWLVCSSCSLPVFTDTRCNDVDAATVLLPGASLLSSHADAGRAVYLTADQPLSINYPASRRLAGRVHTLAMAIHSSALHLATLLVPRSTKRQANEPSILDLMGWKDASVLPWQVRQMVDWTRRSTLPGREYMHAHSL